MNDNLLKVVKHIAAEYGEDVLGDAKRLKAFFGDLAKDEPKKERMAFGYCVEEGAYTALKSAPDATERAARKTAIAQKVNDEHGIDVALSAGALDILEAALFGEAETSPAPPPAPPAQPPAAAAPSEYQAPAPVQQDALRENSTLYQPAPPLAQSTPLSKFAATALSVKKRISQNVLLTALAGLVLAVIVVVVSVLGYQQQQRREASAIVDAELRSAAAEIAEIAESDVFEGFDPSESIQHYYFVPISVYEFQRLKEASTGTLSPVTSYATDDGVIKARRAGYQANYGVIVYRENDETVLGLADVTLKEEDVNVGYGYGNLKYSLSNRLEDIEQAIYARTGKTISLSNVQWSLNTGLSGNVKASMNKHNVNYSMTIATDYSGRYFTVNKKGNGGWYYFSRYF
jgi:hypothetical protein